MTPKSEAAAAERKVMDRYEARLARAWEDHTHDGKPFGCETCLSDAKMDLRILRASAAALYPGDQQRKHLLPALGKMVTAACRVIRKGAK